MTRATADRGEYRSIYLAFGDDPDVHRLPDRAFRVLINLKLTLPASGIGVVYDTTMAEKCHCTRTQLEQTYKLLERPRTDRRYGWIVRERNLVWLVNGLRFEPTLSVDNIKKHRPFIRRLVDALGDSLEIVRRFRAYYAPWFMDEPTRRGGSESGLEESGQQEPAAGKPSDTSSIGYPGVEDTLSKHSDSDISSDKTELDSDSDSDARATAAAPLADASPAADGALPQNAERWIGAFYGRAAPIRRVEIRDELLHLLNGGTVFRKQRVSASATRLDVECRRMILDKAKVRVPNAAMAILLTKILEDPEVNVEGRTVTEQLKVDDAELRRLEDVETAALAARVAVWRTEHPDQYAAVERHVRATLVGVPPGPMLDMAFQGALLSEARQAMAKSARAAKRESQPTPEEATTC